MTIRDQAYMAKIEEATERLRAYCRRHGQAPAVKLLMWPKETVNRIVTGSRKPTETQAHMIRGKIPKLQVAASLDGDDNRAKPVDESDPKAMCLATIADLRRALAELNADPESPVKEKAQVATALTGATRLLAKLTGETEITEAMILKSPAWKRLEGVLKEALRPFPDAMQAVVEVVESHGR